MSTSFDIGRTVDVSLMLEPDNYSTGEQHNNTEGVDMQDAGSVAVVAMTGSAGDLANNAESLTFLESDTNSFSDAADLDSRYVVDNPDLNAQDSVFIATIKTNKRYLFVQTSELSAATDLAVAAVKGNLDESRT